MTSQLRINRKRVPIELRNHDAHAESSRADRKGKVEKYFRAISSMTLQSANFDGSNAQFTIDDRNLAVLDFITRYNVQVLSTLKKSASGA
jgi:hypothetical protein